TIKMLAGLLKPSEGRAKLCGTDVWESPEQVKRSLGYIPDDPFIYELLTGREFLYLVSNLYGVNSPQLDGRLDGRVNELIDLFDARDWIDRRAEGYSHGMRQKTVLAATLLHEPKIFLIDEPMVGLDPASMILVKRIFLDLAAGGCALLISTHTLSLAESICRRIGIISQGKLVATGTLDELRKMSRQQHTDLENLYLEFTKAEPGPAGNKDILSTNPPRRTRINTAPKLTNS
ncbi:MAG: ABC transporter ATP-binding protein, partial [Candidatus Edwardsbacteria bacterium]|nr:ABC transporter ATP-binding protein [Candidatus Edwardsbacteria bacterium]